MYGGTFFPSFPLLTIGGVVVDVPEAVGGGDGVVGVGLLPLPKRLPAVGGVEERPLAITACCAGERGRPGPAGGTCGGGETAPLLGGRPEIADGGTGEGVPRVGGVGEDTAPRGTGDMGALIGANAFPPSPCPNGLPVVGSTLTTWGPVGCVTPCVTDTTPLDGLGSWPAARNLDIMSTSPLDRPAGPVRGPAAPAPCANAGVGEAAVALSDDDPVAVVGGVRVAGVVLGVAVTVDGDDLVDVVGGDVVRPSEVCPGLCCCCSCIDLMSIALPLPRGPSPGGPFPPGGIDAILKVCGKFFPLYDVRCPNPTFPFRVPIQNGDFEKFRVKRK